MIIGEGKFIRGIEEGLLTMKEGEKSLLHIPPDLGFGLMGVPPKIPGSVNLYYMVTLLKVQEK